MAEEFSERRPYNAVADFVDANVERGLGGKVAFSDPQRTLTYDDLQTRTSQFATALGSIGLRQECRVAILLHDTIDFPVCFWGAIRAGVVVVPLNTLLTQAQYAYMLADSRVEAIVLSAPLAAAIAPLVGDAPHLRTVIVAGSDGTALPDFAGCTVIPLETFLADQPAEPFAAPTNSDEVAFWFYTSGSTGNPKAVKHVHTSLMATARLMGQGVLDICSDDVVFSAPKLCFAYGLGNALSFPNSVGASTVLWPDRVTAGTVLDVMRQHRPTVFSAVPALYAALLAHEELAGCEGLGRLRICVSAGEALPAHIGERWREITGVDILDGIGSTEMLQTFLSNRPGDIRYGSTGKPVPGYDVKIVDDDGGELGTDEIGELVVRGPSAGEGYWNQRAKTRSTFVGEWTHTGDKYYRDSGGYYYFCGRTDDMFKVNGMWVSPFDVEAALVTHDAVLEAAVIGRRDADGLIKPKAFLVLKDGSDGSEDLLASLRQHVKEQAGRWKYPRWIEFRRDLPRTATGKIQRYKLREEDARQTAG